MAKAEKVKNRADKPYRRNTGRKELRGHKPQDDLQAQVNEEPLMDEFPEGSEDEDGDDDEPKLKAYDALLTLLKPEKEERSSGKKSQRKKVRVQKSEDVEGFEEDAEQDDVEEEEDDDDNGVDGSGEIQVEDDNEGDLKDPFETHFANPDPKVMEIAQDLELKPTKSDILGDKSRLEVNPDHKLSKPIKVKDLGSLKLKYRLEAPFGKENGDLTQLQKDFATPLFAYQDILYPQRTLKNANRLQNMYVLHAINHIYKTRDRVLKNNAKLSAAPQSDMEYRDQGFTRPKVLVLLPTKNACWKFVNKLYSVSGLNQSENKKRFKDAFYEDAKPPQSKPEDFREFFAGNTDDLFCLGVKFTRQAIKLYSSFYSSDLIVASPLGLQRIVGNSKKPDSDFLSSIEMLIVDQADGIYMQNWENVDFVLKNTNLTPKESHGCDFSRVREWYIHQKAHLLRQTVILCEYGTPEINHSMSKYCHNIAGKLRIRSSTDGVLSRIGARIRQSFTRLHSPSPVNDPDVRFKHFTQTVLPSLLRGANYTGTLIYVPSYNDFLRVRRYAETEKINCTCVCEYDEMSHISRARSYFADGRVKILIITERFHHYRRYDLKGVNQVVMYGVPQNPKFYVEVMRFMLRTSIEKDADLNMFQGRLMFSKFDNMALQRIVGNERNGLLMQGSSDTYEFT